MTAGQAMQLLLSGKKLVKSDARYPWVKLDKDGRIVSKGGEEVPFTFKPEKEYEEYKDEFLTKDEKTLLRLMTADFGKKDFLRKREQILQNGIYETIQFVTHINGVEMYSQLPYFVRGAKFENLELNRGYHKEELKL